MLNLKELLKRPIFLMKVVELVLTCVCLYCTTAQYLALLEGPGLGHGEAEGSADGSGSGGWGSDGGDGGEGEGGDGDGDGDGDGGYQGVFSVELAMKIQMVVNSVFLVLLLLVLATYTAAKAVHHFLVVAMAAVAATLYLCGAAVDLEIYFLFAAASNAVLAAAVAGMLGSAIFVSDILITYRASL